MEVLVRTVIGVVLVAHGLVHLLWWAPSDDPAWPFRRDRSWLLPAATRPLVAASLVGLVVGGFALLGLAVWGVPVLTAIWPVLAIVAAAASLAALVLFWDRRLLAGVAIDVAVLVVAWWQPGWTARLG
jgi:hypothetical protein